MTEFEETKDKIINTACPLFSEKGFAGVSIREIAKKALVNLAAINYHFSNKKNLYRCVLEHSMNKTREDIEKLYKVGISVDEFSTRLYNHFINNSDELRIGYKMMLDDSSEEEGTAKNATHPDIVIGPPGATIFFKVIEENKPGAKKEDVAWAVRILFAAILHKALIVGTQIYKQRDLDFPDSKVDMEKEITRLAKVVLSDVR